jgi:hypothetical protein
VIEEQKSRSNVEFLAAHRQPILAPDKPKTHAQFRQKLAEVVEWASFHVALVSIVTESQEIKIVRILGEVLCQIRLRSPKSAIEIDHGFSLPAEVSGLDLGNDAKSRSAYSNGPHVPWTQRVEDPKAISSPPHLRETFE